MKVLHTVWEICFFLLVQKILLGPGDYHGSYTFRCRRVNWVRIQENRAQPLHYFCASVFSTLICRLRQECKWCTDICRSFFIIAGQSWPADHPNQEADQKRLPPATTFFCMQPVYVCCAMLFVQCCCAAERKNISNERARSVFKVLEDYLPTANLKVVLKTISIYF